MFYCLFCFTVNHKAVGLFVNSFVAVVPREHLTPFISKLLQIAVMKDKEKVSKGLGWVDWVQVAQVITCLMRTTWTTRLGTDTDDDEVEINKMPSFSYQPPPRWHLPGHYGTGWLALAIRALTRFVRKLPCAFLAVAFPNPEDVALLRSLKNQKIKNSI